MPVDLAGLENPREARSTLGPVVSAVRGARGGSKHLWVAWPGGVGPRGDEQARWLQRLRGARLCPVLLSAQEAGTFFDGFCVASLWPVFYGLVERAAPADRSLWERYRAVNARYADAAADEVADDDVLWVHDYPLCLVPALLRERLPPRPLAFSLHAPFPPVECFRALPWREELLRGVLAADVVTAQTQGDLDRLQRAAVELTGARASASGLTVDGRSVVLRAVPAGLDAAEAQREASAPAALERAEALRRAHPGVRLVLSVERLDYTRCIPLKLLAIERFFAAYPTARGRVRFTVIAQGSRERIDGYEAYRRDVHELVTSLNGRYATPSCAPVTVLHSPVDPLDLRAHYLAAEVLLSTALREGLSAAPREYVAARSDGRGVVIASEFDGVSTHLPGALVVNPYDLDDVAEALRRALSLPEETQRQRMRAHREVVLTRDASWWAREVFTALGVPWAASPDPEAQPRA